MTIDSAVVRKEHKGENAAKNFQKHQQHLPKN